MGVRGDSEDRGGAGPEDRQKVKGLVTEPQGMRGHSKGKMEAAPSCRPDRCLCSRWETRSQEDLGCGRGSASQKLTQEELLLRFPCSEKRSLQVTLLEHSI